MRLVVRAVVAVMLIGAAVAGAVALVRSFTWPIRVATYSDAAESTVALQSIERALGEERSWVRIERVPVASSDEAASAVAAGKADVAVLRSDVAFPPDVRTLIILQRQKMYLIAPAKTSIDSFRRLRDQKIGLLRAADAHPLGMLLGFYGIAPSSVTGVPVRPSEVGLAIQQKQIAAVLVVGPAGWPRAGEVFDLIAKATKTRPQIIGVEEAAAVAERIPSFEAGEIAKGAFQGRAPEEETTTVTVALHLVANRNMRDLVAGELVKMLMSAKARLQALPAAAGIEAPDTEQTNYAIHPGAKAYFDGEDPGIFGRFESLVWIGSAVIGVLGSALTWLLNRIRGPGDEGEGGLSRLIPFLKEVRHADAARLEELSAQLDQVLERVIDGRRSGTMEADEVGAYHMALGYAQDAIRARRAVLNSHRAPMSG